MNTQNIISKCRGVDRFLLSGINGDVMSSVVACYDTWKDQPAELVSDLRGLSDEEKCVAVFRYMVENVEYKLDPAGGQLIKSPARLIHDGCGDCKSLTMFVSCCLHCLRIPHIIRFVDFGTGQYTHVYPVAIVNGEELIMDMCEKDSEGVILLDFARKFERKKDFYYNE